MDATILIVDDQPENLKVLLSFLKENEFQVRVADSGERALSMLEKFTPELILLDIVMPGLDGLEVCRRLKVAKATRDIPVIFMTVLDRIEDKIQAFDAGGVDYITKPFQQAEVVARVHAHVALRKKSLELEKALKEVRRLQKIIPICMHCKQIRNDSGFWQEVELYISEHTDSQFSHGICPDCYDKLYSDE